jgi:hypothetical protein
VTLLQEHSGPKCKDLDKLLEMLRGNDEASSTDSQLQSQNSQESSDGKENTIPASAFPFGNPGEQEPMEWEDTLYDEPAPQPVRRSRTRGHVSDTDSD